MAGQVTPIPEGFQTLTPHLVVKGANEAIEFYKKAFSAEELNRMPGPDGQSIMHATLKIGDSMLMLNDEFPDMGALSPASLGGSGVTIHVYVNDVDAAWKQALDAGAVETMPLADQFWGDRYGMVKDPYGHNWSLGARKEILTPEEVQQRAGAAFGGGQ